MSALENARSLRDEAKLLLDNCRAPRANLLALIGAEEVVKASILAYATALSPGSKNQWRDFWWVVRNHDAKELFNYVLKYVRGGFLKATDFFEALEHTGTYLDVRNLSAYVDRVSSGWLIPDELLPLELVRGQVEELERRLESFESWKNEADVIDAAKSIDPSSFREHSMFTEARAVVGMLTGRRKPGRDRAIESLDKFLRSLPRSIGKDG